MNINAAFYKKSEQPLRMCIFLSFNGVATMVGALLSFGLGHATHAAIKPWKLIFLTIGLLNFCWSIIFTWFCPSTPADARFFNEKEKAIAVERVAHNYQGLKNDKLQFHQIKEAAMDLHCWFYALVGMGVGVVNGGSSNFQSALLKGFGFSGISTTILQLPTGAIEWVVVTAAGIIAIFFKNSRSILLFLTCVPGTAGLIGIHVIPLTHKWALVGCTWLQYIVGGPVILSWILLNANVAGQTKRTITNGMWFAFYAAGNIIGANIFYTNEAPKYKSGIIGLLTSYCGVMFLTIFYGIGLIWQNKRRDAKYGKVEGEAEEEAIINGFKDLTDRENTGFRYCL
ncbi:unnamed protein product [Ambrosiozyma monospora]|uniref:Unnamed protein product n=2 Tax=Ambrosiozyma monospora TaxID=43982 RepID=A0ACB5TCX0_AMBMO|nr:unnamed protein product [Ambrosiozyma monospora]